jgi:uncharacterized membrane protein YccC
MILTAIAEFIVTRNYAIAAIFITANALLIAEKSTKITDITYFMQARITDIAIVSAIGLLGTWRNIQ